MTPCAADEARARLASFAPVGVETIALAEAGGRVLGEDFVAPAPLPPWPRAAMDGFAVRAADCAGASEAAPVTLRLAGEVPTGGVHAGELAAGDAIAIATGGVVPAGADAVVMIEHAASDGAAVGVRRAAAPGQHVIATGEDVAAGERLLARGRRLRPADLAALAGFGHTRVTVFRRPRVAVLSTGTEVVAPDATPRPGQVRDMNQVALAAAIVQAGGLPESAGLVADDPAALEAAIARAAATADVVLIAGGSSVGARDFTGDVLARLGARVEFAGVHLRPGRPTLLARLGDRPILGLPGVPASALVVFAALVASFLRRLGGEDPAAAHAAAPRVRARLAAPLASARGREDWVRVTLSADGLASPLSGGNMAVGTLVRATGLVCVPAAVESLAAGADVEILLT